MLQTDRTLVATAVLAQVYNIWIGPSIIKPLLWIVCVMRFRQEVLS